MQAWKTDIKMGMMKMMSCVQGFAGFNQTLLKETTTTSNFQIN